MDTGLVFTCKIGSLDAAVFAVAEFELQEHLSELFTLTLLVTSGDANIDYRAQLDLPASLTVKLYGVEQRTVRGIVSHISRGNTNRQQTRYHIIIRPEMYRLTLVQDSRIFHHLSVPDILKTLLQEMRIAGKSQLNNRHRIREYVTQKRESNWDFWRRLAAEEGISFWFEDEGLFYADSNKAMIGGPTLIYNPQSSAIAQENVTRNLKLAVNLCPDKSINKDRLVENPDYDFSHEKAGEDVESPYYSVFDSYGRFANDKDGAQFTQYRIERLRANSEIGSGESNCFKLRPGLRFHITRHPAAEFNAPWQIISVTHHGSCPQAMLAENGAAGTTLSNSYSFIADRYDWRPAFLPKPGVDGSEVAEIVGPEGEEIYTDELGRVKIHFHWNRYDEPDDRASCWVRVAQGWNGDNYGFMAIPRIGQEVLVDYLNGDVDRPIITGCNYNGRNSPPLNLPDEKTRTTFKTQTHKGEGFNELRFEDAFGRQEVFIHAQKDMNTKVLDNRTTQTGNCHTETVGNNQTVTIGNNQSVTVNKNQQITVKEHQVETVALTSTEAVGLAKTLTVGAGYAITVGAAMNTLVALSQTEQVGINKSARIGHELSFEAGDCIELKCGNSLLRMDSLGKVTIKGTDFSFIASGPVQISGKDIDLN